MKKYIGVRPIILFTFCTLFLFSCWLPYSPIISGRVLDNNTGRPIDSVIVELYEDDNYSGQVYSDANGYFFSYLNSKSRFLIFKRQRDLSFSFSKNGYNNYFLYNGIVSSRHLEINLKEQNKK